ncbi:class I SAM-dependent methyltransferase [Actinokineospora sp. UTMC 2448]|uniref:class I SAM-dependent methyltransferase n=1 Tax=Actinokineospora sp. UTMC 2448 TaxID=2268449 RepID=UPI002164CB30|nr:class I SAM-dependent methyltransferase [Actinokineospora sp. UTMC 2448]UVS77395.1 3-demethylubiquinone-9 3-O-methyltransferase [Actinokineospora sp. UTMC 2448]
MDKTVNDNWESYWRDLPRERGLPVWDSDGAVTATAQLPVFRPYFDAALPVLDIGCGNGTQTAALAEHFPRVIGMDFAQSAIEHARTLQAGTTATFRTFDLTDADAARAVHDELGDVNVYLRGVLHQMPDEDRPQAAAALSVLLGDSGHAFAVELAPSASASMKTALGQSPDAVPKLQRVFRYGLTPAAWDEGKLDAVLDGAGMAVVARGEVPLHGTDRLPDGSPLRLPMVYVVARNQR